MTIKFELRDKDIVYLGDGVYCRMDEIELVIYTFDGVYEKNHIFLDDYVLNNLIRYIEVKDAE